MMATHLVNKSNKSHFLYNLNAHKLPLLDALSRKGGVMRETTPEQAAAGIRFRAAFLAGRRRTSRPH
jgi:hypothetical protein